MQFFCLKFTTLLCLALAACNAPNQQEEGFGTSHKTSAHTASENTLIVTADEKYKVLRVKTTDPSLQKPIYEDTVTLGNRAGVLCQNKAKNPETHYGFQVRDDLSKYYFAFYKGSLMKEEYEWCRLYAYDPSHEKWTQLIDFGEIYEPIWKYVEGQNAIVYIDRSSGTLLSYQLDNKNIDTLRKVNVDVREHVFEAKDGQIKLSYIENDQVKQIRYNLSDQTLEEEIIAHADGFSSIHQEYVLQVYFENSEEQGFRLYHEGKLIADQPFTVGNVNSFWNENDSFYLLGEEHIFMMNTELDTLASAKLNSPFIYNVLEKQVLAHERKVADKGEIQPYLLPKDLSVKQATQILENARWVLLVREI
ncbi:hypothetical protein OKW21_005208 [Catalinimonas alkaloidigena]|uniref:hypothetical protein n=1 Tax=Catalinimonas alkaloidigena TaxID=1075417 RepID=UPI0024074BE7|nr:hypothetical protein [Catalinimonas alkaloidigena]MDF9799945.1 hypothetical protein [Catalinimonas alkaloidigena]